MNDSTEYWECSRRSCQWKGTDEQKVLVPTNRSPLPSFTYTCPKCGNHAFYMENPLFIPLRAEFFDAFERGEKKEEYRLRNNRWNMETCRVGRRVILSRGYGKKHRLTGVITGCHYDTMPARLPGWLECYGPHAGDAVVIKISLDPGSRVTQSQS